MDKHENIWLYYEDHYATNYCNQFSLYSENWTKKHLPASRSPMFFSRYAYSLAQANDFTNEK